MTDSVGKDSGGGGRGLSCTATLDKRLCITVPEAAEMLAMSKNHAYAMVKSKEIPSIKFGKKILIPRAALEKMLEMGEPQ